MTIYISLIFFYFLIWFLQKTVNVSNYKIITFILLLPLFLISGFRNIFVGNDTLNYVQAFNRMASDSRLILNNGERFELGFVFINEFFSSIDLSYLQYQIFISACFYLSIYFLIKNHSLNPIYSILIFVLFHFFFQSMNLTRQYMAITFVFLAFNFLLSKNIIRFGISVFIASLFHSTAWIFLLAYPLSLINLKRKYLTVLFIMAFGMSLFFDRTISLFFSVFDKYQGYGSSVYFNNEGNIAIYFGLIINLVIYLLVRYFNEKELIKTRFHQSAEAISLLALVVSILGINAPLFSRLVVYFSIFYIIIIPFYLSHFKNRWNRALANSFTIVILIVYFFVIAVLRPYWSGVIPYEVYSI